MPEHPLILKALWAGLVGCLLLAIGPLILPCLGLRALSLRIPALEATASDGDSHAPRCAPWAALSPLTTKPAHHCIPTPSKAAPLSTLAGAVILL